MGSGGDSLRSDAVVASQTESHERTMVLSASQARGKVREAQAGDLATISQSLDRGSGPRYAGVVFAGVSGAQENRRLSSCFRPLGSESAPRHTPVPHGIGPHYHEQPQTGGLGGQYRHQGCLSARPNPSRVPKVLTPSVPRKSIPVPGSPVWGRHGALRVHQTRIRHGRRHTPKRGEVSPLLRRLADSGRFCATGAAICQDSARVGSQVRVDPKLGEVLSDPHTMSSTCGDRVRSGEGISFPPRVPVVQVGQFGDNASSLSQVLSTPNAFAHRPVGVHGEAGTVRSMFPASTAVGSSPAVAHHDRASGHTGPGEAQHEGSPPLVVGQVQHPEGPTVRTVRSGPASLYGCVNDSMGGSFE